jgi:hypothetical protein
MYGKPIPRRRMPCGVPCMGCMGRAVAAVDAVSGTAGGACACIAVPEFVKLVKPASRRRQVACMDRCAVRLSTVRPLSMHCSCAAHNRHLPHIRSNPWCRLPQFENRAKSGRTPKSKAARE